MKKFIQLALATTLFLSCSLFTETIDPELVHKNKDKTAPVFTILSPVAESLFEERVTVRGIVDKEDGKISSIKWSVSDTLTKLDSGTIDKKNINPDRSFSFDIATVGYSSDIIISVSVVDWNGNASTKDIKLLYSGTFIPSFNAVSKNKSVELTWNAIDGINSYTIYYTDNESRPTPYYHTKKEPVTTAPTEDSPLIIDGLQNGGLYRFMISATDPSGTVLSSRVMDSIPQSINTFTPEVSSIDNTVHIRWNTTYDGLKYNVFRSEEENGDYINISGDVSSYQFTDRNVTSGTTYYYKVAPALNNDNFSATTAIRHIDFNINGLEVLHDIDLPGESNAMVISNNCAYIAGGSSGLQVFDLSSNRLLYTLQLSGPALDITGKSLSPTDPEGYVFIALGDKGVDVVKIKEGRSYIEPRFISNYYESPINAQNIERLNSNYIYISERENGFRSINISDKTALIGRRNTYTYNLSLSTDINTNTIYVANRVLGGFQLISFFARDSGATTTGDSQVSYPVSNINKNLNPTFVKFKSNKIYAGSSDKFHIFSKGAPTDPATPGSLLSSINTTGPLTDILLNNTSEAYLLEGGLTIRQVDISNVNNPKTTSITKYKTIISSLKSKDGKIIAGKRRGGLIILQDTNYESTNLPSYSYRAGSKLTSYDNNLYIQEDYNLHEISLDNNSLISSDRSHTLPSSIHTTYSQYTENNDYIYYINNGKVNIYSKVRGETIGVLEEFSSIQSINRIGDLLILGNSNFNFIIVDISKSDSHKMVAIGQSFGQILKTFKIGTFLYILDDTGKMNCFNIREISNPIFQSRFIFNSKPTSMIFFDEIAAVGKQNGHLEIISFRSQNNPVSIKDFDIPGVIGSIKIVKADPYIIAVDTSADELHVYSISNPLEPSLLMKTSVPGIGDNFTVVGDKLYYIDSEDNNTLKYIQLNQE